MDHTKRLIIWSKAIPVPRDLKGIEAFEERREKKILLSLFQESNVHQLSQEDLIHTTRLFTY
jgi:hypothetical protein